MSDSKHTPGPWEFGKERRWLFRDNPKADGKFSSSTILKVDDDAFRPTEADAALITSAPELLAVLKKHERRLSERATYGTRAKPTVAELNEMLDDFRTIIAKAEGRSTE